MTVNPELSERHNKELSAQLNQPRAMAGEGTTRSRTLGGSVTQSLASIVRALVSMHQESMRSSLSPAGDFKADSDWRGMRGFLIGVMGMKTRVDYYDARIHSYGF
jgi:hypothetical protein